ncbi:MAG: hypothetical protein M3083_02625 [Actinomycetota bacterium]|nr:hypothetical protein [Actinomycetota bacterium]
MTVTTDWTNGISTEPRRRGGNGTGSAQGPPLIVLAVIFSALFAASVAGVGVAAGGGHFPSPYDPIATLTAYLTTHHGALVIAALLQFAAAIPLAIFAATASARLHHLGIRAPGATIALVGGVVASTMLIMSASCQWVLAQPGIRDNPGVVRALQDLAFLTGGPGHVVPLGLLIAGIAVVAAFGHLLPRPLALAGVAIALVAEVSTLSVAIHASMIARRGGSSSRCRPPRPANRPGPRPPTRLPKPVSWPSAATWPTRSPETG